MQQFPRKHELSIGNTAMNALVREHSFISCINTTLMSRISNRLVNFNMHVYIYPSFHS